MDERNQDAEAKAVRPKPPSPTRMPENSVFYEKVVPLVLVVLGIVTVALIVFALGVLVGVVPFQ